MSLSTLRISGLSFSPDVREDATCLQARTSLAARLLSLFAYDRRLTADRTTGHLYLVVRRWWVMRSLTALAFNKLEYVWYSYGDFPLDFSYVAPLHPSANMSAIVTNQIDWFNVAVKVQSAPQPLLLYRCLGEGGLLSEAAAMTPPFHWLPMLLRLVALEGDEEDRSRALATSLARFLGIPLSSPLEHEVTAVLHADRVPCPNCGRALQRHAHSCVYCGTQLPRGAADTD